MDNKFKCTVDVELEYNSQNADGFDYDQRHFQLDNFIYSLDVNFKSWGIDSIYADAPDQDILFDIILQNKKTGDCHVYDFTINLVDIVIDNTLTNHTNLSRPICPVLLTLCLTDLVITGFSVSGKGKGTLKFC